MVGFGNSSDNNEDSRLVQEINVLLVSNDKELLVTTADTLESFPYKVTTVENAMAALSILSKRQQEFDLVLVDVHLNDSDAFELLKLVANMDLLAMLTSEDDQDDAIVMKAIESGAYMLVPRPLSVDIVKLMRQSVIRKRLQKINHQYDEQQPNVLGEITGESEKSNESKGNINMRLNNGGKSGNKRKGRNGIATNVKRSRKHSNNEQECDSMSENYNNIDGTIGKLRKKVCTEWTEELHEKFMDAVNHLGEGRCYPKEILELMNVPGLTRMQVASHLQKCRNDNWRAPEARKQSHSPNARTSPNEDSRKRINHRKFGSMPHVDRNQPNAQESYINSSFGSDQSGNGRSQDFHHVGLPKRFGSYPFGRNSGRQSFEASGGYALYEGTQSTITGTRGEIDINSKANSSCISAKDTVNRPEYDRGFSGHGLGVGGSYHSSSVNQKQPHDDFFNYLREMDDQTYVSQQFVYDSNRFFSDQHSSAPNRDIKGQWSQASSFFGK